MFRSFENWNFGFVSDWSETDASPDIRISDLRVTWPDSYSTESFILHWLKRRS